VDYLTKPIQAEEVLARVGSHLTRMHLQRELRQSRDRLDRELANAARMQRLILPRAMPAHSGIEFAAFYQTSRHAGGDYYDVLDLGGDRFAIMVADVSGHGAPAAIVMAMIRAVVHTYPGVADDPPAVLHYINRHFQFLWETPMYATAVYAVVDTRRGTVRVASAGHPLPLMSRNGEVSSPALDTAMCLLWDELGDVPCVEVPIARGDRWMFFTDGITDRMSCDGSMFDLPRLSAALTEHGSKSADGIASAIVSTLEEFSTGCEPEDDQTLLVVGFD
jgi:sigma-B regulation protein RsbU (phosphoserine phosphatase)